jgi:hypothetical protein
MIRNAVVVWLGLAVCLGGDVSGAGAATSAAADAQPARRGVPLSPTELFSLYQGRTWLWAAGGAYFSPQPRTFVAWSRAAEGDSYAEGKWLITTDGQVCFRAKWHSRQSVASALTCFAHKRVENTIYQRRLPKGDWYVFKSPREGEAQEYSNFKPGDDATAAAETVRLSIESEGN